MSAHEHAGNGIKAVTGDEAVSAGGRGRGFTRRRLVGAAGVAGLMGVSGFGGEVLGRRRGLDAAAASSPDELRYPFRGEVQQGILTPAQDTMYTVAYTVTTRNRDGLRRLLTAWTSAAEKMVAGEPVGGAENDVELPPSDTGEVWGYPPSGLTITFGFGRSLFVDEHGGDRFGLKDRMPRVLADGVPKFANEALRAAASDGDILIQTCSNDPQVCVHAVRNLTRIAFGSATLKWGQIGYGRSSSTSKEQRTPRNLLGFKDGTANLKAEDDAELLRRHVWVQPEDDAAASWLNGGTYVVARKIHMHLEVWDRVRLSEQQEVIGRDKYHGAPLSVSDPQDSDEFARPDFAAPGRDGGTAIPADSHVAVVGADNNQGVRMLRRSYNYTDGNDSLGRLDAGMFFVAFVRDPRTGFYPVLKKMTEKDALTEYLQHQASALFAVPPGIREGDALVGQRLFD
jgi:deferrochelatase/peroxidase EfeB